MNHTTALMYAQYTYFDLMQFWESSFHFQVG